MQEFPANNYTGFHPNPDHEKSWLGANGIIGEYPIMRHANNLESIYTYEVIHHIHTLIAGEAVTGIAAYR